MKGFSIPFFAIISNASSDYLKNLVFEFQKSKDNPNAIQHDRNARIQCIAFDERSSMNTIGDFSREGEKKLHISSEAFCFRRWFNFQVCVCSYLLFAQ